MTEMENTVLFLEQDFKDLRSIVNQDYKLFKEQLWDLSTRLGKLELAQSNFLSKGPNLKETNFQDWVESFGRTLEVQNVRLHRLEKGVEGLTEIRLQLDRILTAFKTLGA